MARSDPGKRSDQQTTEEKVLLEAKPDWDRMGEIADRLLSTPPDRQAVKKGPPPKKPDDALPVGAIDDRGSRRQQSSGRN